MLKQKFILHFSTGIGIQLISSITGIAVARLAGPQVIGTVAFGVSYVGLFSFTLGLFGSSHLKLISEGKDLGNCITTYSIIQSVNIGLFIAIFILYNLFHNKFIGSHFSQEQIYVIWIYFTFFVISQFLLIMQITFNAQIDVAKASISLASQSTVYNAARVAVVAFGFGAIALTASNYIGLLIAFPVSWYYFKRYPFGKFDKALLKDYLKVSFPFFIIGVCNIAITDLGRVLLAYFNDVKQVGLYTAGYSIAGMLLLISSTTGTIFFPLFSKLVAANNFELIKDQIQRYERFILQFIFPFVLLIFLYANFIITTLLGKKYFESGQILQILIISSFIKIFMMPHGNLLAGMGLFKTISLMNIAQVLIFIISLLILLPKRMMGLGAIGLSLGLLAINIFYGLLIYYFLHKKTDIKIIKRDNVVILLWGLVLGLIFNAVLYQYISKSSILYLLLGSISFLIIFYLLLLMLKQIKKEDFLYLMKLFNLKNLTTYIKGETKE